MNRPLLPILVSLAGAALLSGCGHPAATGSNADQQTQERLTEERQARQLSELHEREAALDERERLLAQREQPSAPLTLEAPETPAPVAVPPPAATPPAAPPATPAPVSTDASYQAFYDALSPYGSWLQIPGYGYVWQPAAARSAEEPVWRPYTLGHWVFTDQGWNWVSDEPFGWITYHYGRWMRTRTLGWVWTPGEQWAPAWVSWRYGNNFVGWAPLPPEARFNPSTGIQQWTDQQYNLGPSDYTFVPASEFGDDNMADNEVPQDQAVPIYDNSNNCTNIYYDTTTYAIICYGPNYDFMCSRCRRPLHSPFNIRRFGFHAGGDNREVFSGNTLQVAAPRVVRLPGPMAPKSSHGLVSDTRVTTSSASSSPAVTQPPRFPLNPPPHGVRTPPSMVVRTPTRANPPGVSPDLATQKAREMEIIEQQRAERDMDRERHDAAARQAAARQEKAEAAAREQHAADEAAKEATKTAREQEARHATEKPHAPPPSNVPAGSPAPGR